MKSAALIILSLVLTACTPTVTKTADVKAPSKTPVTSPVSGVICGGMRADATQDCAGENEYCHRDIKDVCGAADAPGVCRETPKMCTMDYNPVCGCDGKIYPNECAANSKGVSAAYEGECKP